MSCPLTDAGKQEIANFCRGASISATPIMSVWCEEHGKHHAVELEGDFVASRFREPPVDAPVQSKPETYRPRRYCDICFAYHIGDAVCPGPR